MIWGGKTDLLTEQHTLCRTTQLNILLLSELGNSLHKSIFENETSAQKRPLIQQQHLKIWKRCFVFLALQNSEPAKEVTVLAKADIQPKAQITLHNKILKYQHETPENIFTPVFLQMDAKIFTGKKIHYYFNLVQNGQSNFLTGPLLLLPPFYQNQNLFHNMVRWIRKQI